MQSPVFLLGSHKSGTSLLRSMLDGHKDLFVFPKETHFFQYANFWVDYRFRRNYPKRSLSLKDNFLRYIKEHNRNEDPFSDNNEFRGYDLNRFLEYFDMQSQSELYILIKNYLEALCFSLTANTKYFNKIFVEKSVENAEFACLLRHAFPDCKFIHIVRNPYATITAIRKMKTSRDFPLLSPIVQSMTNSYYYLFKNSSYLENYMILRYEDLLENPEKTMKKLCKFLQIHFQDELLIPTYLGQLWGGNSTSKEKFSGISTKPILAWQSKITPIEIKIVNNFFRHVLERFEYDLFDVTRSYLWPNKKEGFKNYFKNRLYLGLE